MGLAQPSLCLTLVEELVARAVGKNSLHKAVVVVEPLGTQVTAVSVETPMKALLTKPLQALAPALLLESQELAELAAVVAQEET